jgi:hypothetical protein
VTQDVSNLEARAIVLELMMRGILTMLISNIKDPLGLVDRLSTDFEAMLPQLQIAGADQTKADAIRKLLLSIFEDNMRAVTARILRAAEQQATAAGGARN